LFGRFMPWFTTAGRSRRGACRHNSAVSQHVFARGLLFGPAPSEKRAQGMPGARCARGLVCNDSGRAHTSIQVTPESPGIPRAMVYGLYRALPGARALWSPSSRGYLRETWRQRRGVRTTRLHRPHRALSSEAPSASTASRPALVTIAKRPSSGTGQWGIYD
jgi:hypothetical protein